MASPIKRRNGSQSRPFFRRLPGRRPPGSADTGPARPEAAAGIHPFPKSCRSPCPPTNRRIRCRKPPPRRTPRARNRQPVALRHPAPAQAARPAPGASRPNQAHSRLRRPKRRRAHRPAPPGGPLPMASHRASGPDRGRIGAEAPGLIRACNERNAWPLVTRRPRAAGYRPAVRHTHRRLRPQSSLPPPKLYSPRSWMMLARPTSRSSTRPIRLTSLSL